nr:GNAT family N-acetyltransferase [Parabacteroides goldsteinii]
MRTILIDKLFYNKQYGEFISFSKVITKILSDLKGEYPNFDQWILKTFNEVSKGQRTIILKMIDSKIVAISIIKHTKREQKLCTVRVMPKFKDFGIGTELMRESLSILKNDHPLATVSAARINEFRPLLRKINFEETQVLDAFYKKDSREYVFNGFLKESTSYVFCLE